ncbi:6-bladed beta-propeller, partial [Parabacteroides sp. OttesenSCG-928-J18]|nr:6-bladed beta-propeller [Parabacteroides sp. OttesenSCG-928-J18]
MNNKCHLLLLLMVFLLFGCGERSQLVYDPPVFKNKYQATTEIFNDSFIFTTCKKILTTEEWVILIDHTMDHMIHLFDKKTGELKLSTGTRGNGPGELIAPEEFSLDRKRNILYIHDSAKRRILKYALDKLICGEKDFFEEILIGEEIIDFVTIHFLKDSLFVANGDEHQLNIITPNTIVSSSSEDS